MPQKHEFLARNAVIAALADATLIVEAPESSGSLNTAHAANDLGKQVFVVPANISSTGFRGSHELIRSGATLVDHPDQILDDLGILGMRAEGADERLTAPQRRILDALRAGEQPLDRIAAETGIGAPELLAELTVLEVEDRVMKGPVGYALKP
jgi:DNA processing protein